MTQEAGDIYSAKDVALTKTKTVSKSVDGPEIRSQARAQILESDESTREIPQTDFPGRMKKRFPARQRSVSPLGVDRMQSLKWESNKVEKIITETKDLLDHPGAVHEEARRYRHRSRHTINLVRQIKRLSSSEDDQHRLTRTASEGETKVQKPNSLLPKLSSRRRLVAISPHEHLARTSSDPKRGRTTTPPRRRLLNSNIRGSTQSIDLQCGYSQRRLSRVPTQQSLMPGKYLKSESQWKPCCVKGRISIESNFTMAWDLGMLLLLIYVVFVTPFWIVFESLSMPDFDALFSSPYVYVDILIDFVFLADLLLNFVTTTHNDHGEEIFDCKKNSYRYLKSWFIIDLLSCIPFDLAILLFALVIGTNYDPSGSQLVQTAKLSRIFKSLRIFRLTKAVRVIKALKGIRSMDKFFQNSDYNKTMFIKSMVLIITVMHLLSCAWVFIGVWDATEWAPLLRDLGFNGPHDSWIVAYQPWQDLSGSVGANIEIYINGLLFVIQSFTTVGYGDIIATNPIERLFAVFLCFFGALLYGYVIAAVTAVVLSWNQQAAARHKRMDEITDFMRVKKFPTSLRTRIYAFFHKNLIREHGELGTEYTKSHTVVLEGLATPLRKEVTEFLLKCAKGELIASIPIFNKLDRSDMALLMPLFKRDHISSNCDIITQGERNWEMFVLMGGKAVIRIPMYATDALADNEADKNNEEDEPLFYREEVLEPGACFGVMQMLGLGDCKLSVIAKSDCDLWSMSGHDVHHAFKLYPSVVKQLKKTCSRMYTSLLQKAQDNPNQQPAPGVNLYMETVARFHVSRNLKINDFDSDWYTRNNKKQRVMRKLRVMGLLKTRSGGLIQQLEKVIDAQPDKNNGEEQVVSDNTNARMDANAKDSGIVAPAPQISDADTTELITHKLQAMEERLISRIDHLLSRQHHRHRKHSVDKVRVTPM